MSHTDSRESQPRHQYSEKDTQQQVQRSIEAAVVCLQDNAKAARCWKVSRVWQRTHRNEPRRRLEYQGTTVGNKTRNGMTQRQINIESLTLMCTLK